MVVVGRANGDRLGRMRMRCVACPMGMDRPTAVVLRRAVIGMGMDERPRQGRSLQRQRQRKSDDFPHKYHFILREPRSGVKGFRRGA